MSLNKLPHDHGPAGGHAAAHMPSAQALFPVSQTLRLLGDATRLRIFWLLCHCRECVVNISAIMDMSSPAVSHHLKQLRDAGLIVSSRQGKEVYYAAADTQTARLLHDMMEQLLDMSCPGENGI